MKITLDIPDGCFCGFLCGVKTGEKGLELFAFQLGSDDFRDGKVTKLPREEGKDNERTDRAIEEL